MRALRNLEKNASYHVWTMTNYGDHYLKDFEVKDFLVHVLEDAHLLYDFKVWNFCILDDHVHLFIQPLEDDSLTAIMRWINSQFATRYFKFTKLPHGHLWAGRFKSKIIKTEADFYDTMATIDFSMALSLKKVQANTDHRFCGFLEWFYQDYGVTCPIEDIFIGYARDYDKKRKLLMDFLIDEYYQEPVLLKQDSQRGSARPWLALGGVPVSTCLEPALTPPFF